MTKRLSSIFFLILLLSITTAAQSTTIPSPKSVLGFNPGDDRTVAGWSQITDYFERLDRASDRVLVQTLGQSTLKRPLIVAFISARENILALPKYKEIQQQLADPRKITQNLQHDRLLANGKVVVAISCSIHSTEIVASQMSMQLAYELATAQDADTREILQNTILMLIPSPNPDGIDIVANWYRKTLNTPYEGKEPPELYHHYAGHDDNRDWFMLNLKETQLITRLLWHDWFPQIVYDVHQQCSNGSRFFIPPFYDPPNPNISPLLLRQVGLMGHKVAADLQAAGFKGVLTNALYDTWWHGGFRTAPYFHNSIGILSEAASARLMSPATVTTEQLARSSTRGMRNATESSTNFPDPWPAGQWRPRDIMAMEMISARSILEMAAKFRVEYLRNFYELGRTNIEDKEGPQAYLIPAGQGRDEAVAKLVGTLVDQGVEVYRLDRELHALLATPILRRTNPVAEKLGSYRRLASLTSSQMQEVPLGSYIIFLAQPQRTNVLALFEPQIYPNRLTGQGEAERPYDVAGWTLPLQMGVEAPVVMGIREPAGERKLTLLKDPNEVRADLALPLKNGDESPIKNPVKQPVRVGIYKGWTSNMDEGWTRYIFDTFNVPYTSVRDTDMKQGALSSKFDALIFTSQSATQIINGNGVGTMPQEYTGGITEAGVKNLKEFVSNGGMLICFDNACDMAIKEFNLPLKNTLEGVRSSEFYCPGSIVALDVDNKNPIASMLPSSVPAYFINSSAYTAAADANVRVIARYAKENVLLSGWLLGEDKLSGQIALAEVNVGKGRIVLFGFRPQHRGQAWATLPFIWNALSTAANNTSEE
ncbi:MAG TPA: M14 family metallopeptidase [Pyrinomonadaceae bacterium]|nr:M14 family metallopeptidase [Pyrinomonadaceae bacterium]